LYDYQIALAQIAYADGQPVLSYLTPPLGDAS